MARKLEVEIIGDASSLQRALRTAETSTSRFGSALLLLGKSAAISAGAAGLTGLYVALKRGYGEYTEQQTVAAQTNAVLKSTGAVANVSAQGVGNLATSLSNLSGIDDETIQAGENMLLTFRKISNQTGKGNDIFNQATKAITDMDVAMSHGNVTTENLSKTAILVGKALNDPLTGLTALRRVGVTFSQQQRDQIKALLDTGKTAKEVTADRVKASKALESAQNALASSDSRVQATEAAAAAATDRVTFAREALRRATEGIKSAQDSLKSANEAEKAADDRVVTATDAVRSAKQKLTDTQKDARRAQRDLTQARKDAVQYLEDMKNAAIDAQLGERGAVLAVMRAREHLTEVMADSNSTQLDVMEATLAVQEAEQGVTEATQKTTQAVEANDKAQYGNVQKTKDVLSAQQAVADAHRAEVEAAKGVKDAQRGLAQAYVGVEKAQRGVAAAMVNVGDAIRTQHMDQIKLREALAGQASAVERVKAAQGDQAKAAAKVAAAQDAVTKAQKEQVGPAASLTNLLKAQKIILAELRKEFGGSAKALGETFVGMVNKAINAFDDWAGAAVKRLLPQLVTLGKWVQVNWPQISATIKKTWETDIKPPLDAFSAVVAAIAKAFSDNWGTIGPLVSDVAKIVSAQIQIITGALQLVADLLSGDWSKAWTDLKGMVTGALDEVKAEVVLWKDGAVKLFGTIGGALKGALVKGLGGAGGAVKSAVSTGLGKAAGAAEGVGSEIGGTVKSGAVSAVRGIGGAVGGAVSEIGTWVKDNISTITGWGESIGKALWSGLKTITSKTGDFLVSLIEAPLKALIKAWNAVKIPKLEIDTHIPGIGKVGFGPINFPDIHILGLAQGGTLTAGQMAVVGEQGPELFVPNVGGTVVPNGGAPAVASTQTIQLILDGAVLAEVLIDPLRNQARLVRQRTGRPAFG